MSNNESAPINPEDNTAKPGKIKRAVKRILSRNVQAPAGVDETMMKTTSGLDAEQQSGYAATLEWASTTNRLRFSDAVIAAHRDEDSILAARKEFGGYQVTDFKQPEMVRPRSNAIHSVDLAARLGAEAEDHLRDINGTNVTVQDMQDLKAMEAEQFNAADVFDNWRELPTTGETFQGSRFQLELQTNDALTDKDYTDSDAMYSERLNFTPPDMGFAKPENQPPAEQGPLPPLPPIDDF